VAFKSAPTCTASPYSNSGAWYFSTLPSTTSSGVITYVTSGAQTFSVQCSGVGGSW
jgi:predicted Na+-dependent transporter